MKKRVLSLVLTLCLFFGMTAQAFVVDGIDYPTASELNVEAYAEGTSIIMTWEPVRDVGVEIVEYYAYCRDYNTDFFIMYEPLAGEYICEFSSLEYGVEYDVGVVINYETGYGLEGGVYITPIDQTAEPTALVIPEAAAILEDNDLTVRWTYPGDPNEVLYWCMEIAANEETLVMELENDGSNDYSHTFVDFPYDECLIILYPMDLNGNYGEPAVIEVSSDAAETPSEPAVWPFTDVDESHPNYDAINFAYSAGLMLGTGDGSTFAPDMSLSRAMTARILHTMVGNPASSPSSFTDVVRNFWYTEAIDWASTNKVIAGNGKGQFNPNLDVTREQLAVMLYQFARSTGFDVSGVEAADLQSYYDGTSVSSWARTAVQWACATGVLSDDGLGNLLPTEPATRAEVAEALLAFVMFYS